MEELYPEVMYTKPVNIALYEERQVVITAKQTKPSEEGIIQLPGKVIWIRKKNQVNNQIKNQSQ